MTVAQKTPGRENADPSHPEPAAPAARVPAVRPPPSPPASAQSRKRLWWRWAGAGALALVIAGVSFSEFLTARPTPVSVEIVSPAPVTRVLAVNGQLAALHSVAVRPRVSGAVVTLPVAEGETVVAGQVLARIDAEAQNTVVRQAIAALDATRITRDELSEAYDRSLALGDNVARSVLESEARAVQSAERDIERLTAVLEQAQVALRDHTIRAPMNGTILVLNAEVGQVVDQATHLLTLADLRVLIVEADVDEAYAMQISPGQTAVLQLAGETGTRDGQVTFVSRQVDIATGGLAVRIGFDDPVDAPVGLTVAANIIVEQRDAALTVPRTALQTKGDETGVFIISDGVAHWQPVRVVDWPAARLIVTAGLGAGDTVITEGTGIAEGQSVAVDGL